MRGATVKTLQPHQILRLPRKMNLMIDPHHICNVIYNAWSNRHHPPTAPSTAPATQNESHDWSASHMQRHLQCAEQKPSPSNLTKYCACHAKWISWLIALTYETSFTMRGATGISLRPHQILRLPRKMNLMIAPRHIWNVTHNARSNSQHPPTSPNTAPATQNDRPKSDRNLLKTAETQFPMRGRSENDPTMIREWSDHEPVSPQPAAQQRLLFTLARSRFYWKLQRFPLQLSFQISPNAAPATKSDTWTSPNAAPATQNESHDWSASHMQRHLQCAEQKASPSNLTKYCACHAKWISWLIALTYETSCTMRRAARVTLPLHQILRLPRKMNLMIAPRHIWNVTYNARSNSQHPPTSPNTAPATQNDRPKSDRNLLKTAETQFPMRGRSENDPTMIREWSDHEPVSPQPAAQQRLLFTLARSRFYWKLQRFPLQLSFQISPNAAPATKSNTWTSPNAAPATQNESHDWSASHMKRHLQCVEQQASPSNRTKYCACHAKWMSWLTVLTYETSFPMRRAARVTLPLHQVLRLPRKMNLMFDPHHIWNVISNARSNRHQSPTSPNTAPTTQNSTPKS